MTEYCIICKMFLNQAEERYVWSFNQYFWFSHLNCMHKKMFESDEWLSCLDCFSCEEETDDLDLCIFKHESNDYYVSFHILCFESFSGKEIK